MTSTSAELQAIDLTRVNVDAMTLEELQAHANGVLDTIGALNLKTADPRPDASKS